MSAKPDEISHTSTDTVRPYPEHSSDRPTYRTIKYSDAEGSNCRLSGGVVEVSEWTVARGVYSNLKA